MSNTTEYAFVKDVNGNILDPTKAQNAWRLIRQHKADLICKYPLTIQLHKRIKPSDINNDRKIIGIDDGALYVGMAIVQECKTYNKVIFKGTIELRNDVHKYMQARATYRHFRRRKKRYRKARYSNRKKYPLAPTIKQKKDSIIRVVNVLSKNVSVSDIFLEDVSINLKNISNSPSTTQYENLRRIALARDEYSCVLCGRHNTKLEVHHIRPKGCGGSDTIGNLVTLCLSCHQKVHEDVWKYADLLFSLIDSKDIGYILKDAAHVMIGKNYLRDQLSKIASLHITYGYETAAKRRLWNIEKTHSNDAICITDLKPNTTDIKDWVLRPQRRQSQKKYEELDGIKHRDYISYTYKDGREVRGYVISLFPGHHVVNIKSNGVRYEKLRTKRCKLLWRFGSVLWL